MSIADRTHYETLGIARDANADEVRRAWKMLVQVWHPDRFTGEMAEEAEAQASRINAAYHALRDSGRRAAYDCRIAADEDAARPEPARPRPTSTRTRPQAARAAHIPGATQSSTMVIERSLLDSLVLEVQDAVRQYPRLIGGAVAAMLLLVVGTAVLHAVTGPSLPSGALQAASPQSTHEVAPTAMVRNQDVADLDALARQAREDTARANEDLARMMAQDAAAQSRADAAAEARAEAAAAAAPPASGRDPRAGGAVAPTVPKSGGHVVRVMPAT